MHHFTYRLKRKSRIVRIGKGTVDERSRETVARYLWGRYSSIQWHSFEHEWHSSEAAALKKERALTERYEKATGELPSKNSRHGGGGRRSVPSCRKIRADGTRCQNNARPGNYGFCGVHR